MQLRQGEIYWVNDCPPLHGSIAAPHAVIIINPTSQLTDPGHPVHGMVVSSSIPRPGPGHILMPNTRTHSSCRTGFSKPCWAVTSWILRITDRSKLGARGGYVGGKTLEKVVLAFIDVVNCGKMPMEHPPQAGPGTSNRDA